MVSKKERKDPYFVSNFSFIGCSNFFINPSLTHSLTQSIFCLFVCLFVCLCSTRCCCSLPPPPLRTDGEIQRTREFAELVGINYDTHKVGGVIWYGFAAGGLGAADSKKRRKSVDDVLEIRP